MFDNIFKISVTTWLSCFLVWKYIHGELDEWVNLLYLMVIVVNVYLLIKHYYGNN
jgi:hypothetical protein